MILFFQFKFQLSSQLCYDIFICLHFQTKIGASLFLVIISSYLICHVSLFLTISQYLVIMSLLFIVQLSISIGALAVTTKQQKEILKAGWDKAVTVKEKVELQQKLDCCGFETKNFTVDAKHPSCSGVSYLQILRNH